MPINSLYWHSNFSYKPPANPFQELKFSLRFLLESVLIIFLAFCVVLWVFCLRPVSCVPNVAIVHSWFPFQFSLTFIHTHTHTHQIEVELSIGDFTMIIIWTTDTKVNFQSFSVFQPTMNFISIFKKSRLNHNPEYIELF